MELKINIENCYGIGKIKEKSLDFSKANSCLLYAQNGVFKTSFAKSLTDLINNEMPKDNFYPKRESKIEIEFNGHGISKENVAVFHSYDEKFNSEDSVTTFMAKSELKQRYDDILSELEEKKKALLKSLKGGFNYEKEIETIKNKNFYEILDNHLTEIENSEEHYSFKYHDMFDKSEKVKDFVNKNRDLIEQYFNKYKELLSISKVFKHTEVGDFGTNHANDLKKALENDRFFKANHSLMIAEEEIKNYNKLSEIFEEEKNKILNNENLKNSFANIEKAINANKELKAFKDAINRDNTLLTELLNYDSFREKVLFSYLKQAIQNVRILVELYREKKPEIEEIIKQANKDQKEWVSVIEIFNQRFLVPFKVKLQNQKDILLNKDAAQFRFIFSDDNQDMNVQKEDLQKHLSGGEKRALYILQILFEIEARKRSDKTQLLVFDDISDSFDYRNKHAIIEYLNDLQECRQFKLLVMTHNFDFYRTLGSRLNIPREQIKMIRKNDAREITFESGGYLKSVIKCIRDSEKDKDFFALIPFVRNLIEYTSFQADKNDNYIKLTSCLHMKEDTKDIQIQDISKIFDSVFGTERKKKKIEKDNSKLYFQAIYDIAEEIYNDKDRNRIELQNKIILSMAIRLKAEEWMLNKLNQEFESEKNQTRELYDATKKELSDDEKRVIQKVLMITPENIHINSFMFEPILDISLDHLYTCLEEVKNLN
ncbi:ABC transporter ATP-binding protein [Helicobacter pylori]|uniref:ATP-binding cassette domain-containing protein n=1 Tax=Helicobacter pylori TaxID=210 RepID=UPI000EAC6531|nr:ABC transporter ATP-binding protein [Helicobacter pylori]